jgi:hypothetical protein
MPGLPKPSHEAMIHAEWGAERDGAPGTRREKGMTQEEIDQYAEQWAEQHELNLAMSPTAHEPLPQVLAQFGWDLQKAIVERLSEIVLGPGQ